MKKEIDLIIFDLDGTLVDSGKDIENAVNVTLTALGLPEKTSEEIRSYVGTGLEDLLQKVLGRKNTNLFSKAIDIFQKYYIEHHSDNSSLYKGVEETLSYLKNKRKAMATNRRKQIAVMTLKKLNIKDYFEDIIGGDDLVCLKPNSCPLDRVITKFQAERDKTIMVGDMAVDVLAGKKARVLTCAVTYGIGRKEDIIKANPDYIVDDIRGLREIILL